MNSIWQQQNTAKHIWDDEQKPCYLVGRELGSSQEQPKQLAESGRSHSVGQNYKHRLVEPTTP